MSGLATMPRYEDYKDSGVDWIGKIPEHWRVTPLKFLLQEKLKYGANESGVEYDPSLPRYIRITDFSSNGVLNEDSKLSLHWNDGKDYLLQDGDILFARSGATVGKSYQFKTGISCEKHYAFAGYLIKATTNKEFLSSDYLNFFAESEVFNAWREVILNKATIENIGADKYSQLPVIHPPLSEISKITSFLDTKTTQIDQAITIKEQQIELLKERRQILIQNAVTRGLDLQAPMRDSGVEWIGDIPAHWEVKRLKYILDERGERSKTGEEPLLMMSQVHGLVVRSEYHSKAEVAQTNVDNKIVYENDLVFNKLKAHLGVFFKSSIPFKGSVSPDYAVYKSKGLISDLKYLELLFRNPAYIAQFIIRATGIVEGLIRLYTGDLFDIAIPVPPENEQQRILAYIDEHTAKFDQAITLQQQQIEKLKEYRATLINSAVTGKIKVV
ncbi:restriction endonuclease subunit S [Sansalvadorimonas verongulae]|uniref:restriction endonuclease subunit S n=1 Tax=Sansalvadorimonas verongulae TaxID=2172824 RepID=UPI0012BC8FF0|nr:restriction endonuclease subunit S [Sansalvadorimonas verongulae]MTI13157.1 restriction endonuclease subunit S [Sansalvadorimonas verongulae]